MNRDTLELYIASRDSRGGISDIPNRNFPFVILAMY